MAANHVLYFIEGTFLFFFPFIECAYGKKKKEEGCEFSLHIPLRWPLSLCTSEEGSEDNKSGNWQGCPLAPFLSPTTWPCPIYLYPYPMMPCLSTKLFKSCPLYLVPCYVRIFFFIKASTRRFFYLLNQY